MCPQYFAIYVTFTPVMFICSCNTSRVEEMLKVKVSWTPTPWLDQGPSLCSRTHSPPHPASVGQRYSSIYPWTVGTSHVVPWTYSFIPLHPGPQPSARPGKSLNKCVLDEDMNESPFHKDMSHKEVR